MCSTPPTLLSEWLPITTAALLPFACFKKTLHIPSKAIKLALVEVAAWRKFHHFVARAASPIPSEHKARADLILYVCTKHCAIGQTFVGVLVNAEKRWDIHLHDSSKTCVQRWLNGHKLLKGVAQTLCTESVCTCDAFYVTNLWLNGKCTDEVETLAGRNMMDTWVGGDSQELCTLSLVEYERCARKRTSHNHVTVSWLFGFDGVCKALYSVERQCVLEKD